MNCLKTLSHETPVLRQAESRTEVGGEASPKDFPTSGLGGLKTVSKPSLLGGFGF